MSATPRTDAPHAARLHVACLCAAWCRTCESYASTFRAAAETLAREGLAVDHWHWVDIEDEAELVGELDIETFPTLLVFDGDAIHHAGPIPPQPEQLLRLLRAVCAPGHRADPALQRDGDWQALARRLRRRE